jgi:hypothetical protein
MNDNQKSLHFNSYATTGTSIPTHYNVTAGTALRFLTLSSVALPPEVPCPTPNQVEQVAAGGADEIENLRTAQRSRNIERGNALMRSDGATVRA